MKWVTKEMLDRIESGRFLFSDPCVICGLSFKECPHSVDDTQRVIKAVRHMSTKEKEAIR